MPKGKILFSLSGSIACFKAAQAISDLVKQGYEVQTAATPGALQFLGEATLEGLTGRRVFSDVFARGQMMDHIHWARWADLSILCPATSVCINSLAAGSADHVVGTLFMAHDLKKRTVWIAPAMNTLMLEHPATQNSLKELETWGVRILYGTEGSLACGEWGAGRMIEPQELVKQVLEHFGTAAPSKALNPRRIVVTAGGTREYLDPIRCLTNSSTGSTAQAITERLLSRGHRVDYFHGEGTLVPGEHSNLRLHPFVSARDLESRLLKFLAETNVDSVVHAAAVSDYTISKASPVKLDSRSPQTLPLLPSPKIVEKIRKASKNPNLRLVAFKLTHESQREERILKSRELLEHSAADLVVSNDRSEINATHHAALGISRDRILFETPTKSALAEKLCEALEAT